VDLKDYAIIGAVGLGVLWIAGQKKGSSTSTSIGQDVGYGLGYGVGTGALSGATGTYFGLTDSLFDVAASLGTQTGSYINQAFSGLVGGNQDIGSMLKNAFIASGLNIW